MGDLDGLGYRDTTVVVTGCASGMGEAAARILGELGAKVHAVDVAVPTIPYEAYYPTDLTDLDQVDATAAALRGIGPIDFFFGCAGVPHTLGSMTCMMVNYVGGRHLIDSVLPALRDGAGIAVISSDAGMGWQARVADHLAFVSIDDAREAKRYCEEHPDYIRDGYSISKEALIVWVQRRAVSLGEERGIRINAIGPCPTATKFVEEASKELGDSFFDEFPYPLLGRIARPEEQGWPLVLLNSRLNNVVSGSILYTDQAVAGGLFTGALAPDAMVPKHRNR